MKTKLKEQWDEMLANGRMPIFEIPVEDEFEIYNISFEDNGLSTDNGLFVEFEEDQDNLDYYLEGLMELCQND